VFEWVVECALFVAGQDGGRVDYQVVHREEPVLAMAIVDDCPGSAHPRTRSGTLQNENQHIPEFELTWSSCTI
jgi:hypothetical protein